MSLATVDDVPAGKGSGRVESTTAVPASDPEGEFGSFVKKSVGLVGAAVSAVPLFLDQFSQIPSPTVPGAEESHGLSLLAAALSAMTFLLLFWVRERVVASKVVWAGALAMPIGVGLVVAYLFYRGSPAISATLYMSGTVLALGGVATLFVFGFSYTSERAAHLVQLLPRLTPQQWRVLKSYGETLAAMQTSIDSRSVCPQAVHALRQSEERLYDEQSKVMESLKSGTVEVRGPLMDTICKIFLAETKVTLRATSCDDLTNWASDASRQYLTENENAAGRGVSIERIFLLRRSERIEKDTLEPIRTQIRKGFTIRLAFIEDCDSLVSAEYMLDFGLFDEFAVSFWGKSGFRTFRITASQNEYKHYDELYRDILALCVVVPDKSGDNEKVFENDEELDRWYHEWTKPSAEYRVVRAPDPAQDARA